MFGVWGEVWKGVGVEAKGVGKGEVGVWESVGRNLGQSRGAGKCGVTIWDPNSLDPTP